MTPSRRRNVLGDLGEPSRLVLGRTDVCNGRRRTSDWPRNLSPRGVRRTPETVRKESRGQNPDGTLLTPDPETRVHRTALGEGDGVKKSLHALRLPVNVFDVLRDASFMSTLARRWQWADLLDDVLRVHSLPHTSPHSPPRPDLRPDVPMRPLIPR